MAEGKELWLSLAGRRDASCSAPQGRDTDGSTICAVSGGTACICLSELLKKEGIYHRAQPCTQTLLFMPG